MTLHAPYPELDELLNAMGDAGQRISRIHGSQGAAGNISILIGWPLEVRRRFPLEEPYHLPQPASELAGQTLIVTGSGRRLRDIHSDPEANLGAVVISQDGLSARLWSSPRRRFARVTSEFNSHLAVHSDQVARSGTNFHALLHGQPPHLTYLSHIPAYRDQSNFNQRLMRWEAETIVNLPEGIGVLPYILPGSDRLMEATVEGLRAHRVVLWSKHGVMARSDLSVARAADLIEYAESAALFEYMDMMSGGKGEGLTVDELREIVRTYDVPTTLV